MENRSQRTEWASQPYEGDVSAFNGNEFRPDTSDEGEEAYGGELDTDQENGEDDDDDEAGDEMTKPYVGMVFDSVDDAIQFYNRYARRKGFSIRKGSTRKSRKNDALIWREIVCSKEGFRRGNYKKNEMAKTRHRGETRVGCQAKLVVKLQGENGTWVVSIFEELHNHEYENPKKRRLLPSQRNINGSRGDLANKTSGAGLKTNLTMPYLSEEVGRSKNVGFDERDARNYLCGKRKMEIKKEDAQAVLDYFNNMQVENPNFFYSIQLDSDGHLTSFFWSDARSRMDYTCFSDVVCFDATYGTNKYKMPFVPIVGVNHHLQTTFFGGALILDETEASYVWVLETWMKAMKGLHPKTILTDQDSAMSGAIARILPNTCHLFCLWHIFQNAQKHLSHLYRQSPSFAKDFSVCTYNNDTIEEFESAWELLLTKYNLHGSEWMKGLYSKRQQWVPIYSHGVFSADMSTTQRSEGINNFFKEFLRRDMLLQDFVMAVDKALVSRREKELKADFHDNQVLPHLRLGMHIEEDAGKTYTTSVFQKFQEELILSLRYICEKVIDDGITSTYKCSLENRERIVKLRLYESSAECTCQKFEYSGILCSHILKVFSVTNVVKVPRQYMLKRWTRDAKDGLMVNEVGEQIQADCQMLLSSRYSSLCHQGTNIAAKGASSIEVYKVAMHGLQRTLKEVENALKKMSVESIGSTKKDGVAKESQINVSNDQVLIRDPPAVKSKGRPKSCVEKNRKNKSTRKTTESGSAQCGYESEPEEELHGEKKRKNKMSAAIVIEESGSIQCQEDNGAEVDTTTKQRTLSNVGLSQNSVPTNMWPSPGLIRVNQHHRLSQGSIVTGLHQSPGMPAPKLQNGSVVQNAFYLQGHGGASAIGMHHFNQGATSSFVLDPQQPHSNTNVDLNNPSQVYFWQA